MLNLLLRKCSACHCMRTIGRVFMAQGTLKVDHPLHSVLSHFHSIRASSARTDMRSKICLLILLGTVLVAQSSRGGVVPVRAADEIHHAPASSASDGYADGDDDSVIRRHGYMDDADAHLDDGHPRATLVGAIERHDHDDEYHSAAENLVDLNASPSENDVDLDAYDAYDYESTSYDNLVLDANDLDDDDHHLDVTNTDDGDKHNLDKVDVALTSIFKGADDQDFWDNSGQSRPVVLTIYRDWADKPATRLLQRILGLFHWEPHIGQMAIGLRALRLSPTEILQNIEYRPVSDSQRVFGGAIQRQITMCHTHKTDRELVAYAERAWHGPFDFLSRSCDDFTRMMVEFACEGEPGVDMRVVRGKYPFRYRRFVAPLKRLAGRARKERGRRTVYGMLGRMIPATVHEAASPRWDIVRFRGKANAV